MANDFYTKEEIAELFCVKPTTISMWRNNGKFSRAGINYYQRREGTTLAYVFVKEDVDKYLSANWEEFTDAD